MGEADSAHPIPTTQTPPRFDPNRSKLALVLQEVGVYKCPADMSFVKIGNFNYPRVRSMSMSQAFGPGDWLDPAGFQANVASKKYRIYCKTSDIINPGPAMCFVLLDEHPDGINAGGFANMMVESPGAARIIDVPASYHNGAGGIHLPTVTPDSQVGRPPHPRASDTTVSSDSTCPHPTRHDVAGGPRRAAIITRHRLSPSADIISS
jgi:hypothetical protein